MTGAQTLSVVYGLVGNMKVVMEGARNACITFREIFPTICFFRWEGVDRWYSTGFGYVSHAKQISLVLTRVRSRPS